MYSTSEALTKAIINGEPINKELRLLGSDGVVIKTIKSLKLYSGSNSTSRIQIGSTNSSYIEASIEYDKVLANREMALYCGIDSEMIPMGIYKIMQEPSEDDGIISFKAYDRMRLLDKLYEPTVAIPNGFKAVVDDIAKQCGVTVNFSYTAENVRNYTKGYTCREMIGYIASMLGTFAYFDRQGVLNFGWYNFEKPVEKTLSSFWSLKKNSSDYKVTGVEFIVNSDTKWLSGSEPNIIYCSNPLAEWRNAENVYYGPMKDLTYRPAEISMLDDIRLDVTDVVKVTLLDGTTIEVPCMTLNQDFTASETKVKAVGNADGEASNYSGPLTTAMDRMTTDLLLTNRVVATKVDAEWVRANTVTADKITAIQAEIDEINANNITADNLSANVAKLGYMSADEADIKYANIKLTNIETANVATLFANVGLIDRATISEGHITGYLDSVEVNASKITAGTLVADRILLKGSESGLLFALNNLGELTSTSTDTLDGYVITERTINADRIVANSITTRELNVDKIFSNEAVISKIFAQDITASGTITGAKLYGTYLESTSGKIADFNITENGFSRELDWVDNGWEEPYKAWCEIDPNSPGYIRKGAGAGTFSFKSPSFKQGYYNKYTSPTGEIVSDKITSFETHMFGMRTNYFEAEKINSDLNPIPTDDAEPTPSGYEYTYYNLGQDGAPWETLYVRNIVVKKSLKDNNGKITAQGDIIAGVGTSNQVSLIGLKGLKNDLMGGGSNYFTFDSYGSEMTLPTSKNTIMGAFSVKKSGWYLFIPFFRFVALPSGRAVSVRVFEGMNAQYPVKNYEGSVTLVGAGVDFVCMNGIQIFQAKANTKYYIYGYSAGGTATCDYLDWYKVYCLKTT